MNRQNGNAHSLSKQYFKPLPDILESSHPEPSHLASRPTQPPSVYADADTDADDLPYGGAIEVTFDDALIERVRFSTKKASTLVTCCTLRVCATLGTLTFGRS